MRFQLWVFEPGGATLLGEGRQFHPLAHRAGEARLGHAHDTTRTAIRDLSLVQPGVDAGFFWLDGPRVGWDSKRGEL